MARTTVVGLAAVFVLSLSACSLPGSGNADSPASDPPATSAPGPTGAATTPGPSSASGAPTGATPADTSQPTSPNELGAPVATRTSAIDGEKVEMTLYPVLRDGTTSHLNLTLTSRAAADERVQVGDALSDGNYDSIDKDGLTADGIQLVDGKNAKLYLVASDGQGQCLCSRSLSGVFLQRGDVLISATFAAPPADVTTVDVRVPTFGTVKGVPVQ